MTREKCLPCEGGVPPLERPEVEKLRQELRPHWQVADDGKSISCELTFADFMQAKDFLNRLAAVAEEEGHHPDFSLYDWNRVRVSLATHAISGLSATVSS